ncbi:MAG: hypothetical protein RMA76_39950 [Deltaproteobacteria bacterium]|jgi:hypothetical protein
MRRLAIGVALAATGALLWPSSEAPDLTGLWARPDLEERAVRFYYFHPGGHGLYRYGDVGLNKTASFDYTVDDEVITLVFRKTGARHEVRYALDGDALTLLDDPVELRSTRYTKRRGPIAESNGHPMSRMWIHQQRYATGGMGFAMYQLQEPDADGRGNGWYHEGDYDDWSTEALRFHLRGDRMELEFEVRRERAVTKFDYQSEPKAIVLRADPRNFGLWRDYRDGGRSFDAGLFHLVNTASGPK